MTVGKIQFFKGNRTDGLDSVPAVTPWVSLQDMAAPHQSKWVRVKDDEDEEPSSS